MTELTDEELLVATDEDWAFYKKVIEGLPTMAGKNNDGKDKNGEYVPYGSGPHIARHFKTALEIAQPKYILEIGLCCGHGSAMLLNLCNASVFSLDISDRDETVDAGLMLQERYPNRFNFLITPNGYEYIKDIPFGMCWLDGAHDEESVTKDIHMCKDLKIPYILADDWFPRFGPGVEPSFAKFPEYKMIKDMDNIKLFLNTEYNG